jgi:SAM-dependent methyltransferase
LLNQILKINRKLLKLIESSSGVVDKPELQELLGKLAAHARVLQLASDRKLLGPPEPFDNLVFPLAVDGAIESAILRLQRRHMELGGVNVEIRQQQATDDCDRPTIAYYDSRADEYATTTMYMDMTAMYRRFRDHLSNSFLFSAGEARNIPDLIARLRDESNPVSSLLWSRFSPRSREALSNTDLIPQRAESILLPELNDIVRGDSIYDPGVDARILLSNRTNELRAMKLKGEGIRRLNRLLLEDAFPRDPKDERKGYLTRENVAKSNRFGGRILDAGCGAGRDTRYFIESGFMVVSFDASEGMVRKCNEYPHAFCQKLSFSEIGYKEEFDGVWACACLMHIPQSKAKEAVTRLTSALKPGGVMFISVKEGEGPGRADAQGRFFDYYDDDTIDVLFNHDDRLVLQESWKSNLQAPDMNGGTNWLNLILKRRERV